MVSLYEKKVKATLARIVTMSIHILCYFLTLKNLTAKILTPIFVLWLGLYSRLKIFVIFVIEKNMGMYFSKILY